jgi:hypothetical protein
VASEGHHVGVAPLRARRALVAALVLLLSGIAAGTAVAHDGPPHWWHGHKADHGHGKPPATGTGTTTTGDDRGDDDQGDDAGTTTGGATTTAPTTPAPAAPAAPAPTTQGAATTTETAPEPQLNHTVALTATSGTVLVRVPGAGTTQPLTAAQALPTGTRVDTRAGEVTLTAAIDAHGTLQTGRFSGGVFEVRQAARGYTELVLVGGHWAACAKPSAKATARSAYVGGRAMTAKKKKKPIRRLWGSDEHGRFQTRGSGSVATVRGTRWLTEDSCAGTRTTVTKGAVDVRSKRTGRTVRVTAGHSLLVRR